MITVAVIARIFVIITKNGLPWQVLNNAYLEAAKKNHPSNTANAGHTSEHSGGNARERERERERESVVRHKSQEAALWDVFKARSYVDKKDVDRRFVVGKKHADERR